MKAKARRRYHASALSACSFVWWQCHGGDSKLWAHATAKLCRVFASSIEYGGFSLRTNFQRYFQAQKKMDHMNEGRRVVIPSFISAKYRGRLYLRIWSYLESESAGIDIVICMTARRYHWTSKRNVLGSECAFSCELTHLRSLWKWSRPAMNQPCKDGVLCGFPLIRRDNVTKIQYAGLDDPASWMAKILKPPRICARNCCICVATQLREAIIDLIGTMTDPSAEAMRRQKNLYARSVRWRVKNARWQAHISIQYQSFIGDEVVVMSFRLFSDTVPRSVSRPLSRSLSGSFDKAIVDNFQPGQDDSLSNSGTPSLITDPSRSASSSVFNCEGCENTSQQCSCTDDNYPERLRLYYRVPSEYVNSST